MFCKHTFTIKICTNEKINERCTGYIDTIIYINFSLLWYVYSTIQLFKLPMQGLKNQHLNSNTMFMVSALWFNTSWNFHSLLWWEINSRWCKKFRHTGYNGASRNCKQERLNERGKDFCSKEQEDWVKTGTSCSEDVYLSYLGILVILVIKVALDLLYKQNNFFLYSWHNL